VVLELERDGEGPRGTTDPTKLKYRIKIKRRIRIKKRMGMKMKSRSRTILAGPEGAPFT